MLLILVAVLPTEQVIFVHGVIQLFSNGFRTLLFKSSIDYAILKAFLPATLIGVGLGAMLSLDLPAAVIKIAIALFILLSVFKLIPALSGRGWGFGGFITGFLTMFVGATGALVGAMAKASKTNRQEMIATMASLMTLQHGLKVLLLVALAPILTIDFLLLGFMLLAGFAGTWVGKKIGKRLSNSLFDKMFSIILALFAVKLLFEGLGYSPRYFL